MTKVIKGLFKVSLVVTLCLFLLFFLVAGAVQVPTVQNYIVEKATEYAEELTGYKASIEGIHIDWFDLLVLEEAVLWDQHNAKMIYLGEAEIDYTIISLLKGHLYFDNITLRDGEVNLVRYKNEDGINITEFIWKIQDLTTPKVKRVGPPVPVEIPKFTLDNMLFSYNDKREPLMKEDYFDHNHFTLDSIHGIVTNLYAVLDTIMLDAHDLKVNLRESHLRVEQLNTSFLLDKHQIECKNLYAKLGDSELKDYFRFGYKDINDLSDFNEAVDISVRLIESKVASRDLAHFAPALKGIKDKVYISGTMEGRVNRFKVDSLDAYFGKSGHIKGKMSFDGLPDVSETFMDLKLSEFNVGAIDIIQYAGASSANFINKFGRIRGKGVFTGLVNDFALKGNFNTGMGNVATDINFKIDDDDTKSKYEGSLSTENFDLGKFLGFDVVQKIDMKGTLKGQGFTISSASMNLAATIKRLGIYNYDYKNIETDAILSNNFFDGHIDVKDTNLVMSATGKVNMKTNAEEFDIDGRIEKAYLEKLNITKVMTHLSTDFNLDFKGTDMDSILGNANLTNTHLVSNEKEIATNLLALSVAKEGYDRFIDLKSDIIDVNMKGDFMITQLVADVNTLYEEFELFYSQNKKNINSYYSAKPKTERRKYKSEFTFNLKNVNNVIDLYYPGIYIAQRTLVKGEFASGKTTRFNIYSDIDSLFYNGNEFYGNRMDVSLSKKVDAYDVLATAYLTSDRQKFKNSFNTEKFSFESQWSDDKIDFSTSVAQKDHSNKLKLEGDLTIKDTYSHLVFRNSQLDILDEQWIISDSGSVDFNKNNLTFNDLKLFNRKQSVKVIGEISFEEDKQASFIVENFKLKNLNPILDYKLNGVLDGQLNVRNIYKALDLSGSLHVKNFTMDDFVFGDVDATADWMERDQQLNVNIDVLRADVKAINIEGNIKPARDGQKEIINLLAHFNSADLGVISPVVKGVMSNISGQVNGSLRISGNLSDLRLKGEANVESGKFKVDYLGSTYTFSDKIYFTEDQIKFKNTILTDMNGNRAIIKGGIAYDGFRNFLVDIKGQFNDFNVLNTTETDNSMFYGVANVTGNFSLFGPFDDLEIRANGKSEKNTKIYIPLSGESEVSRKDFIKFVKKDTVNAVTEAQTDYRVRMFFNMEITPDAYTEIIFDKRAGDIISGRGDGNIALTYDTKGAMTMDGNYTIKEGYYNFAMAGIIPKRFTIDRGSRISWNGGDPYDGIMDIKAKYQQNVSLKPLFDTTFRSRPDLQRYYPTDVVLGVKGNLSAPSISMDIDILRYPSDPQLALMVTDFESKIKTNDQELNRQVFSLIMLRSFTAPNSFIGVSSVGTNNVSELLSGQLSHFLSQADPNLEINLNLNNLDKDALNTLNVRLSYTAMNGRVRISRNGNFQNAQQPSSQANISNIAGEWTVEYQLSQDGNFRMKLFNRINNNSLISTTGTTNTSAGLSFMHVQSFDGLSDLFGRKRRMREEEENKVPASDTIIQTPVLVPDSLLTE